MKKIVSAKAASPVKPGATPSESHLPVDEVHGRIAERAHEFYVQRGYVHGYHLSDWLEAEQEILGRTNRPPAYA